MRMYDAIMMHPTYRREVLVQFGFGEVKPIKVERWFKEKYPVVSKQYKDNLKVVNELLGESDNLIQFKTEAMTREERKTLLDYAMDNIEKVKQ